MTHVPIMVAEVLDCLRLRPGAIVVDCTLGGGGHAEALLARLGPTGRLIGLDLDAVELGRTEARMRAAGHGPPQFVACHAGFRDVARVLAQQGVTAADAVLVDLGVSAMQTADPERGFSYKGVGPLDMRFDPSTGQPASTWLAEATEREVEQILLEHSDEPHAATIARLLKRQPIATSHAAERIVRTGLAAAVPSLERPAIKASVRRTFQALRIAVNDEFGALEALLRSLPSILAPGGRAVVLTFHSGEDRRVKHAFAAGRREGVYADVARRVIQSSKDETRANRRASAAKLRWAVRAVA